MGSRIASPSQILSLPKGGGALQGLGEKFTPDLFTGTGNLSVPIQLLSGRHGFQPELALHYSTGSANGPFGLGWSLGLPEITRKTSSGVPRYDDRDIFILPGNDDLIPIAPNHYKPRTETSFERIEHCSGIHFDYWKAWHSDGSISWFGVPDPSDIDLLRFKIKAKTIPAHIADQKDLKKIFAWKLSGSADLFGNQIQYEYTMPAGDMSSTHPANQVYLSKIHYVDYGSPARDQFLVSVDFIYKSLEDAEFSKYNAGFEIRTTHYCKRINIHTHAQELPGSLVRSYELKYGYSSSKILLLETIELIGHDGDSKEKLPPIAFGYTGFNLKQCRFEPLEGDELPLQALDAPALELVDLFGRGLPDFVEWNGWLRYWKNEGNGRFAPPRMMTTAPSGLSLADPDVQMLDADGDGRVDVVVNAIGQTGYYAMGANGVWDAKSFQPYVHAPSFSLKDPEVRFTDLSGNGVTDIIRSGPNRLEYFTLDRNTGWEISGQAVFQDLSEFPAVSFADPRVHLADMTGDGLQDIVLIHSGRIDYWPSLGHGRWGRRITMRSAPELPYGYDPKQILLGDVDGDGAADLIFVDDGRVTLWLNCCGNTWSPPVVIEGMPPLNNSDALRLIDLRGNGVSGLLWSASYSHLQASHFRFLDFTNGVKPYLLNSIDNRIGAITNITYASSTRDYLADQQNPKTRWLTSLPFPVQVVAEVKSKDQLTNNELTTQYRYHHGYWDGVEREFRGFGRVDVLDAQYHGIDHHAAPPVETRTWFCLGPVGGRIDWSVPDFRHEYWQGDAPYIGGLPKVSFRDAARALRGLVLRSETYALDASPLDTLPYNVSEHGYDVKDLDNGVFFPFSQAERVTIWERGDDPKTHLTFFDQYDNYGRRRFEMHIAVPRGRNYRETVPSWNEHYLVTLSETLYATRDDFQKVGDTEDGMHCYIIDRVAQSCTWRIDNNGELAIKDLHEAHIKELKLEKLPPTDALIDCKQHYYDGAAFVGAALQTLGSYGALVRTLEFAFSSTLLTEVYEAEVPSYLDPAYQASFQRATDYPDKFHNALSGNMAGYVVLPYAFPEEKNPSFKTYWIATERYKYDFQDKNTTSYGLVSFERNPMGQDTRFEYDKYALLPIKAVNPAGLITQALYNYRVMQPEKITDLNGNPSFAIYTPLGLPKGMMQIPKDVMRASKNVTHVERIIKMHSNPNQLDVRWVYELHKTPISVRTIQREHHLNEIDVSTARCDRTLETIEYSDGFGRLLQTRSQAEDIRYGNSRFGDGLLDETQLSKITSKQKTADDVWVRVSGWQIYDNKGRVIFHYEPFWSNNWDYAQPSDDQYGCKVISSYDPLGRLICTTHPDNSQELTVYGIPKSLETPSDFTPTPWEIYQYDANDNAGRTHPLSAESYKDHWNTPSHTVSDALGRVVEETQLKENGTKITIKYIYNIQGDLIKVIDPLRRIAHKAVYDLLHRPFLIEDLDAGRTSLMPDASGKLLEQRNAKGALILTVYDMLERPLFVFAKDAANNPLTERISFVYGDNLNIKLNTHEAHASNLFGRLYQQKDEAGELTFESYDFKGNLLEKVYKLDGREYRISATFDALNRLKALKLPDDAVKQRCYLQPTFNRAGLLEKLTLDKQVIVGNIAYNAKGQRTLVAYGNNIMTRYSHDPQTFQLQRQRSERFILSDFDYQPQGEAVQDCVHEYDVAGNPLVFRHLFSGCGVGEAPKNNELERKFQYDALYRLTKATGREWQRPAVASLDNTPLQAGASQKFRRYTQHYQYDDANNLCKINHVTEEGEFTREFKLVKDSNRLQQMIQGGSVSQFIYDDCGNITRESNDRHFTWDYANHLVSFQGGGNAQESYVYNAVGQRVKKTVLREDGSKEVTVYIDGIFEFTRIESKDSKSVESSLFHVMDGHQRIATVKKTALQPHAQTLRYHLPDHLGGSNVVLDAEGNLVDREEYYPYGETSSGGYVDKRYRFSGKERDSSSSLYYFGARYYAPYLARWLSCDPIGIGDGLNLYVFVSGRPTIFVDKHGYAKERFHCTFARSKNGGFSLKVHGRPSFSRQAISEIASKYPSYHEKNSTKLKDPNGTNRNHIIPYLILAKIPRTDVRGMTMKEMRSYLKNDIDLNSFHSQSFKKKYQDIMSRPMKQPSMLKAFEILIKDEFNNVDNIYIGDASENKSSGSQMKHTFTKLKNSYNDKSLSSAERTNLQKILPNQALDIPSHIKDSVSLYYDLFYAINNTPNKYTSPKIEEETIKNL